MLGQQSQRPKHSPDETFVRIASGEYHTCGVKEDGDVACWGLNDDNQATPKRGAFERISAGLLHTCGLRTDSTIACWGRQSR